MTNLILYPILASLPLALLAGPVGSILIWRRSSFLSDVIAHMGILAFAISEITGWSLWGVSTAVSAIIALLLERSPSWLPKDAWLSSLSSFGIALGLLLLTFTTNSQGIEHVFWGDMFMLSAKEIMVLYGITGFVCMHLIVFWPSLMLVIFQPQLAHLDGVPVRFITFVVNFTIGVAIALCLKIMGVLLTGAIFVLPSIALKQLRLSPEKHVLYAVFLICISCLSAIILTTTYDLALAPIIVLLLVILNLILLLSHTIHK